MYTCVITLPPSLYSIYYKFTVYTITHTHTQSIFKKYIYGTKVRESRNLFIFWKFHSSKYNNEWTKSINDKFIIIITRR